MLSKIKDIDKKKLVDLLRIPEIISIKSPIEEWIRIRLNFIENDSSVSIDSITKELSKLFYQINDEIIDLDERCFCFVRIYNLCLKLLNEDNFLVRKVWIFFEKAFELLIKDSAHQYRLTCNIIESITESNPHMGMLYAKKLNTNENRFFGFYKVLHTIIKKMGKIIIQN